MTPRPVLVVGGGGHGRVIVDILAIPGGGLHPVAVSDADPCCHGHDLLGVPIVGDDSIWPKLRAEGVDAAIVAIGDNRLRGHLIEAVVAAGFELVNAIHPAAVVSRHARLGRGIVVMAGAVVNAGAVIGDGVIVNTLASVDHDCHISSLVHVAPGAHLGGWVVAGEGALLGIGSTVIPNVVVGSWAVLGAGAVAIRDVPPGSVVVGVPAHRES